MPFHTPDNLILRAAGRSRRPELENRVQHLAYDAGRQFWDFGTRIPYVLFPVRGLISFQLSCPEEEPIEIALTGAEGFAGIALFLGSDIAENSAIATTPGEALIMPKTVFREYLESRAFRTAVERYAHFLLVMLGMISRCQRVHSIEELLIGRLLLMHDRLQSDSVHVTQQFFSLMLGVRRASVNEVVSGLREQGAIGSEPGRVLILRRDQLEERACPCYHRIREAYDRLTTPPSNSRRNARS